MGGRCATPSFAPAGSLITGDAPQSVAAGDFNRDGKSDLATANEVSADVTALLNACGAP